MSSEFLPQWQLLYAFQKNMTDDAKRSGANLLEIVSGCVPVTVVHKVPDYVHSGKAAAKDRIMVVLCGSCGIQKKV